MVVGASWNDVRQKNRTQCAEKAQQTVWEGVPEWAPTGSCSAASQQSLGHHSVPQRGGSHLKNKFFVGIELPTHTLMLQKLTVYTNRRLSLSYLCERFLSEVNYLCTDSNCTFQFWSWVQCMCFCTNWCYLYETSMELYEWKSFRHSHYFCFIHWLEKCYSNDWMQPCDQALKTHWHVYILSNKQECKGYFK